MEKPAKSQSQPKNNKPKPQLAAALRANLKRRKVVDKAKKDGQA
ncbi:MAG: hypothetical protein P8P30_04450 [Rickettsiales bacterium]|nr:hypothetical protein [Rickettsiales bacterium]